MKYAIVQSFVSLYLFYLFFKYHEIINYIFLKALARKVRNASKTLPPKDHKIITLNFMTFLVDENEKSPLVTCIKIIEWLIFSNKQFSWDSLNFKENPS